MKITIIGGGIAGLSCGYLLTKLNANLRINILESAKDLGGRCKSVSLTDKITVDNCPHIIFQAQLYGMIKDLGLANNFYHLSKGFEFLLQGESFGYNPAQDKLWALTHKHFKLGFSDYKSLCRLMLFSKHKTVAQIFSSSKIYRKFWYPLCLAIMNDKPDNSSAYVFYNTFKYLIKGGISSFNIYKPKHNWNDDFLNPLARYLENNKVNIQTNTKITALNSLYDDNDLIILATPIHQTLKLLHMDSHMDIYGDIKHNPITSIHYQLAENHRLDSQKYAGLTHIYAQDNNLNDDFWFTLNQNNTISTVHSSFPNGNHQINAETFQEILARELHLPHDVFLDCFKIANKRATINHSNENLLKIKKILQSSQRDNILICGDWSRSYNLPSTLETSFISAKKIQDQIKNLLFSKN